MAYESGFPERDDLDLVLTRPGTQAAEDFVRELGVNFNPDNLRDSGFGISMISESELERLWCGSTNIAFVRDEVVSACEMVGIKVTPDSPPHVPAWFARRAAAKKRSHF